MQQIQIQPVNTACQQSSFSGFITNRLLFFLTRHRRPNSSESQPRCFCSAREKTPKKSENTTSPVCSCSTQCCNHVREQGCWRLLKTVFQSINLDLFFSHFKTVLNQTKLLLKVQNWPKKLNCLITRPLSIVSIQTDFFKLTTIFLWMSIMYLFFIRWGKLKAASVIFFNNAELCKSKKNKNKRAKRSPRLCHLIKRNK